MGEVRAAGLQMAGSSSAEISRSAQELRREAKRDAGKAAGAASCGTATGGGSLAADQAGAFDLALTVLGGAVAVVLVAAALFLALKARARRTASQAMRDHLKH